MTYVSENSPIQIVHDSDSHVMEPPGTLEKYMGQRYLADFERLCEYRQGETATYKAAVELQGQEEFRKTAVENLHTRKRYEALGAYIKEDRVKVLDLMGYTSQLTFTSTALGNFGLERRGEYKLAFETARAHNRMMADFCSVDSRMLATAIIPLIDIEMAAVIAKEALELGCKALILSAWAPVNHSPAHVGFDPLWALAQEASVPIVFHLGGTRRMASSYRNTGMGKITDFLGGDENFTSLELISVPHSAAETMAALIFDGVLDRFPNLKFSTMELGASWVPSWLHWMDFTFRALRNKEDRLKKLSGKPSEIAMRQFKFSPFLGENVKWIIDNTSEDMCMFASDYPHIEGGVDPLNRFEKSLGDSSIELRQKFYCDNFLKLMGSSLDEDVRSL